MKWRKYTKSLELGVHLLACRNKANKMEFFKLVEVTALDWMEPGTDNLMFLGNHIEIVGIYTPTFPKV